MLHTRGGAWSQALGVMVNPYTYGGNGFAAQNVKQIGGERINRFVGETFARKSATPDGYSVGGAWVLPVVAGGMSSWQAVMQIAGAGDLLQGGPMIGTAALSFTADNANAALIVSLAGNGDVTFAGNAGLALTIGMAGNGAMSLAGGGSLSMIIPMDGTGAITLTGAGDVKGNLSMEGSWGGAAPLSPEALAQAVWAELNSNAVPYGIVVTNAEKNAKLAAALSA